jgi:hypothetical protein
LEDQAQALGAIVEQAGRSDPVFSSYGSRAFTDRAAIAKALAGAAATALQHGSPQHPGQWSGLSLRVAPTTAWRTAALELTVTAGYRHSATVEVPKSWLQQGQQWRIVAALQQLVDEAPAKAAELREAAAAKRTRATDSQPLLGRPFEHADKLKMALQRQKELDALMGAEADATAKAAAQAALEPPAEPAAATG